jgi:nitrite reductase (NADH) small subunit
MQKIAKVSELKELEPRIVKVRELNIAIYKHKDRFYAYLDRCPHQGGPPCEGGVVGNVECEVSPSGARKEFTSTERYNILCPWHGFDFDLETGVCKSNQKYRLRSYRVVAEGDDVLVDV